MPTPVLKKLTDQGLDGTIRLRDDTKELYFMDPDNIRVQLQDVRCRGGVGPLGDRDSEYPRDTLAWQRGSEPGALWQQ